MPFITSGEFGCGDVSIHGRNPHYYACSADDIFGVAAPQGVENLRLGTPPVTAGTIEIVLQLIVYPDN
eukprot:15327279-Ditylum_brightwellii.AAC.1